MVRKKAYSFLTPLDLEIAEELCGHTVKLAAHRLQCTKHVIYYHTDKMKKLKIKCKNTLALLRAFEKRSGQFRRLLTPKD